MKRELRISSAAEVDVAESWDYYRIEEPGLESEFIRCVEKGYSRVVDTPFTFPLVFSTSVRRAVIDRFPFAIIFSVRDDHIFVYSVFHSSRNPIIWQGRID